MIPPLQRFEPTLPRSRQPFAVVAPSNPVSTRPPRSFQWSLDRRYRWASRRRAGSFPPCASDLSTRWSPSATS